MGKIRDKRISELSKKQLEQRFKIFTRFLKDNGYYVSVMKYLFANGRTKGDMLKTCMGLQGMYYFGDILHLLPTLGDSYTKLGHLYWEKNINPINIEFIKYYYNIYAK